jgi:hypothetical protein
MLQQKHQSFSKKKFAFIGGRVDGLMCKYLSLQRKGHVDHCSIGLKI